MAGLGGEPDVASPPVATVVAVAVSTAPVCVKVNDVLVFGGDAAVCIVVGVNDVAVGAAVTIAVVSIGLGPPSSFSTLERSLM